MVARSATPHAITVDAVEFIRFCYARRRVGWPELYDEMCAVAEPGPLPGLGPGRAGRAWHRLRAVRDAAPGGDGGARSSPRTGRAAKAATVARGRDRRGREPPRRA